jgi:hypothetical protein
MRQFDPKRSTVLASRTALQKARVVFDDDEHGGPVSGCGRRSADVNRPAPDALIGTENCPPN